MGNETNTRRSFVRCYLPWLAGGAALVFYLCTLNHWISFANMAQVAKISGYSWQSEVLWPLYCLVSAPLRLLPPHWVPLGVNLFSALCASLTLALLARSVALLPHDRTDAQREREKSDGAVLSIPLAWLPPLLAVLVCGLQITFWEHSTNGTPDMVNLLLFAYVIRALLEYRQDEREGWLYKAALAYGALMTSEWLMLGCFPVFLAALIWIRGLSFFNLRFLARLALCGLAGLSLYFLLPELGSLSKLEPLGFWQTLNLNLLTEKNTLLMFPKKVLVLLSLTSALPVLVLSIRSASHSADTSRLGVSMAALMFHIMHALFLLVCLWVMLDPQISPRNYLPRTLGVTLAFLPLYYLSALSVGYFSGYFLLVFRPLVARGRRTFALALALNRVAVAGVVLLTVAVPATLLIKNLPAIRSINQNALVDFARMSGEQMPKSGYLLADDPRRALLARAWLADSGRDKSLMVVETWALQSPAYHRYLRNQHGEKWPVTVEAQRKDTYDVTFSLDVLNRLVKSNEVFYLHPSFGIYFEHFYLEPHGLLYQLHPFDREALLPPPLSAQAVAENQAFWKRAAGEVFPKILTVIEPRDPRRKLSPVEQLLELLHVPEDSHGETRATSSFYSRSLNNWAVELQKTGDLEKAAGYFELALKINPENVAARANLAYNKKFRAGQREQVAMPKTVEDSFGKYNNWDQALGQNGPYDEPNLSYAQGYAFIQRNLYRQAAQAFERVHAFAPEDLPTRLWLSQLNLLARKPDRTLELTRDILEHPERFDVSAVNRADTLCLQAKAYFLRREPERAEALLETAIQASPTDSFLLISAFRVYSEQGRYSNALVNLDRHLKLNPDNPDSLLNKGYVYIQLNAFDDAIRTMTQLLTITNRPEAVLNRAIAYLRSEQLEAAQKDYETLQRQYPAAHQLYFGLGDIAYRRHDTNTAIRHYLSYLSNSIPGSAETRSIETRLQELKGGNPPKP